MPAIFVTNPTSLNNKIDELHVNVRKFKPDVICISEVWQLDEDKAKLDGYTFFQRLRIQRRGGGVGCYVKNTISVKELSDMQPSDDNIEIIWLQIRPQSLPPGSSIICVGTVYFPPSSRSELRMAYEEHIIQVVDKMRSTYSNPHFLICGDFNRFPVQSLCHITGFQQIITSPTHVNSILDVIITDLGDYYREPVIPSPLGRSKHVIVHAIPRTIQSEPS